MYIFTGSYNQHFFSHVILFLFHMKANVCACFFSVPTKDVAL